MADQTRIRKARHGSGVQPRLRKQASASLPELTRELLRLAPASKGDGLSAELRDTVYVLKAYKLRSSRYAHAFRVGGGLAALLRLLAAAAGRDAVLLLGALGNLCALDKQTRAQVGGWVGVRPRGLDHLQRLLLCDCLSMFPGQG